jgi:hypothetical protein
MHVFKYARIWVKANIQVCEYASIEAWKFAIIYMGVYGYAKLIVSDFLWGLYYILYFLHFVSIILESENQSSLACIYATKGSFTLLSLDLLDKRKIDIGQIQKVKKILPSNFIV